jgi:hypothetical protein
LRGLEKNTASRNPKTFDYPVVYPNGAILYCDTEEEQQSLMHQLGLFKDKIKKKTLGNLTLKDIQKQCRKGNCILCKKQILYCIDCNIDSMNSDEEVEVEE